MYQISCQSDELCRKKKGGGGDLHITKAPSGNNSKVGCVCYLFSILFNTLTSFGSNDGNSGHRRNQFFLEISTSRSPGSFYACVRKTLFDEWRTCRCRASAYNHGSPSSWNLCLTEKLYILNADKSTIFTEQNI